MSDLQTRISAITDPKVRLDVVRNILRDDMLSLVGTNGVTEEGAINLSYVPVRMIALYELYRIEYSMPIMKAYEMALNVSRIRIDEIIRLQMNVT